uniref:Uncharacterized protein n=1 Tax=Aegilops tauschii subsp. strangulata TaxID=200361 RepID=A0A452YST6_AEGTS
VASDETLTEHRPRTKPHKHRRITSPSSSPPAPMTSPSAPVLHRQILPRPLVPSCRVSPRTPASVAAQPSPSPRRIWRLPLLRSSLPPEGSPAELVAEDSKFVPLNAEDPMYGPPALLLIGFDKSETVKVIHCTEEMTKQTLWDAMHTEQPNVEAVKDYEISAENMHLFWSDR